jgi:hypothetical protein
MKTKKTYSVLISHYQQEEWKKKKKHDHFSTPSAPTKIVVVAEIVETKE